MNKINFQEIFVRSFYTEFVIRPCDDLFRVTPTRISFTTGILDSRTVVTDETLIFDDIDNVMKYIKHTIENRIIDNDDIEYYRELTAGFAYLDTDHLNLSCVDNEDNFIEKWCVITNHVKFLLSMIGKISVNANDAIRKKRRLLQYEQDMETKSKKKKIKENEESSDDEATITINAMCEALINDTEIEEIVNNSKTYKMLVSKCDELLDANVHLPAYKQDHIRDRLLIRVIRHVANSKKSKLKYAGLDDVDEVWNEIEKYAF